MIYTITTQSTQKALILTI